MEDTLIFVDDGFFGLVKKHFQKEDGKPKKYLQIFRTKGLRNATIEVDNYKFFKDLLSYSEQRD